MSSAVEVLEGLERKLTVTVPSEEVEKAYNERLKSVAKTAKIKGFRPGKVPSNVIEQRFGPSIRAEVAGELMQQSFGQAIEEHSLNIAGEPSIEPKELVKGDTFEYQATFEIYPEIELKELEGVDVEKSVASVTEDDIQKMLENIRTQHGDWADVERAAKDKDRINIDFEGFIDDKPFDGGKAEGFVLELGSKQMIPGFEDALIGVKAGDDTEISVTFPAEYPVQDLAGKEAKFKIKVHAVQEVSLPEVNDALAEKAGIKGGLAGLIAEVRKGMEAELKNALEAKLKSAVLDQLLEINKFNMPNSLIDNEIKHLQQMSRQQMAMQQGSRDLPDVELPREPFVDQAEKRVALGLLLAEVIKKYEIKVDSDRVRSKVEEIASAYQKPEEIVNWYMNNKRLLSEIEAVVLEEQVVEKLLDQASVKEAQCSYDEIVNPSNG